MSKQTARIENWHRVGDVLLGDIYEHPRFPEGLQDAHTSKIVSIDEAAHRCETLNTVYTLGRKLTPTPNKPEPRVGAALESFVNASEEELESWASVDMGIDEIDKWRRHIEQARRELEAFAAYELSRQR